MRLLPDTHLLLWLAEGSPKLSARAKPLLTDPENTIFFSTASIWEVAIKFGLGRPSFTTSPDILHAGLLRYGFIELLVNSDHAIALSKLPLTHGDPFDRLLAAQAVVEDIQLLTADDTLSLYPGVLRV